MRLLPLSLTIAISCPIKHIKGLRHTVVAALTVHSSAKAPRPFPKRMSAEAPSVDYASWSTADLISRVTALESQLRAQNIAYTTPPSPSKSTFKKPKKPSKPFDPSRYHTRLIALKFAYLGGNYNGFEHHNNNNCLLYTSPSPRDGLLSRMPSSA